MKVKELLLAAGEHPHLYGLGRVDAHSLKGRMMGDRRND
jgi:hypothetical protein